MAVIYRDRVKETTTTTGTGTITLAGAVTGFQSFASALADGSLVTYCIENGVDWEVGEGTFTASGTSLSRTTIIASSNAGAAVNWAAGTKSVYVTVSGRDVYSRAELSGLLDAKLANPMTTAGDLLVGQAAALVNEALASRGATASSNAGNWSGSPANTIDGNPATYWEGSGATPANTRLNINLGQVRNITTFRLVQDNVAGHNMTQFAIDWSDDNTTWTQQYLSGTTETLDSGQRSLGGGTYSHRYWRVRGIAGGSNGCHINDVYFYSGTPDGYPARLGAGADDTVLVADSTQLLGVRWDLVPLPTRQDATVTTGSLANLAEELGTVTLGKSGKILRVSADRYCRVRLYKTAAQRTADLSRPVGRSPSLTAGINADLNISSSTGLTLDVQTFPFANGDIPAVSTIYYAIQNRSGSTAAVAVTITRVDEEG